MRKKIYRCRVDLEGFRLTASGKVKTWRTDGVETYCCESRPALFIWEKASKQNNFNPYYGYVDAEKVVFLKNEKSQI